jgi:NAD(P)H-flavin reductase
MALADFYPATVLAAADETPHLRTLSLRVSPEVAASHRVPGQFLRARAAPNTPEAYFAIANPPGGDRFELLIKRGSAVADVLAALEPGGRLEVSPAGGAGFPLAQSRGKDVLLFATGSGIAPIHAALQAIAAEREAYGQVHLFFGVRTRLDFAYTEELDALVPRGIRIHRVVSRPLDERDRYVGYVQERFLAELPSVADPVAFLAGRPEMVEAVTRMLIGAGIPARRIHGNM